MKNSTEESNGGDMRCGYARPCGKPVVAQVQFGCVHEHFYRALICADHRRQVKDGMRAVCYQCWICAEPHDCDAKAVHWYTRKSAGVSPFPLGAGLVGE